MNERDLIKPIVSNALDLFIGERLVLKAIENQKGLEFVLKSEKLSKSLSNVYFTQTSELYNTTRKLYIDINSFSNLCMKLLNDLNEQEKEGHERILLDYAELSIKKIQKRARMACDFSSVYEKCRKRIPHLPLFEGLAGENLSYAKQLLKKEIETCSYNNVVSLTGLELFENFRWIQNGLQSLVFEPCKRYITGNPASMSFRDDLERYASLICR